jgi:hypothetical protein
LSSFFSFKTLNSAKPAGVSKRANILVATALILSLLFNPPLSFTQRTSSQWGDYQKEPSSTLINKTQKKKNTKKKNPQFLENLETHKKKNNNNKSRSQKPHQQIDFDNT